MDTFTQLVSVNFQGVVVVFGRSSANGEIYYNVLGLNIDVKDDSLDWSGFTKVAFTEQTRQAGMSIVTVKTDANTMVPSTAPFRVVTDQKFISVVQQSEKGTLYVNRFRLLKTTRGRDEKTTTYTLSPAWEVRFARSHKEDVPADKSDTQEYLDPDGNPFLEPSYELSMVDDVTDGAFEVLQLPMSNSTDFAWQFLTWNKADDTISLTNIPASGNGLFDLTGKTVDAQYRIEPDSSFSIVMAPGSDGGNDGGNDGDDTALPIQHPPRAALYVKHENVVQPDGTSIGVKRAARAMIAIPVEVDGKTATATIDSALGNDGKLARLSGKVSASAIVPAEFDLLFDGTGYLELKAPGSGDNPLAVAGPYSMRFMVQPLTLSDGVTVIGGDPGTDAKSAAPYVRIVDGDRIEVGFGTGAAAVSCRTKGEILQQGVWTALEIAYAGAGDNPFTIKANGAEVPLDECPGAADPAGAPITRIGGGASVGESAEDPTAVTGKGFKGALNTIEVAVGGTDVLSLPCNDVDYSSDPPTTPNTSVSGVTVDVHGPKQQPSTSPVNKNMSGTFHIDPQGLTYYAAVAGFIQPQSSASLIDGSDGLLHLYYQGADKQLTVCQFSKSSARAAFYSGWTTNPDKPSDGQSGFMRFTAHRIGTYMNTTAITIAPSKVSDLLCDVTVEGSDDIGKEVWKGLPRNIDLFARIWNGAAGRSADDQDVINNRKPYFDYSGEIPSVLAPDTNAQQAEYFLFTSVPFPPVNLASVEVADGSANGFVTITIETTAPPTWEDTAHLVQSWPDVPAAAQTVSNVLSGKATDYDYSTVTTGGTRAYGLTAITARSDEQTSDIAIFVRDSLQNFSIAVAAGNSPDTCEVTICGQNLADVPRDQNGFAAVINGQDDGYDYPDNYKTDIAANVFAVTNGLTATVRNFSGEAAAAGPLPYAGLIRILYSGQNEDGGSGGGSGGCTMGTIAKTDAQAIQSATLTFDGNSNAIAGSRMFGLTVLAPPTDGGTGKAQDTSGYTNGTAPVLAPGTNGGWMPAPPRFSLGLNGSGTANYIAFDVDRDFTPSDKLAISSDMTLESWLNPTQGVNAALSRAITYNVTGNRENPNLAIRYMMGAKQGPGLTLTDSTFVKSAYNFTPPELSVQIYVRPEGTGTAGTLLSVSEVQGGRVFLKLSIDRYNKPVVDFLDGTAEVSGTSMLSSGKWTCLTATVEKTDDKNVRVRLYVNDADPIETAAANDFDGKLGSFTVGSQKGDAFPATVNGAGFWQRALMVEDVKDSVEFGYPDNDPMLGIRWNLADGTGTTAVNSAVTGDDYDADITNPANPAWNAEGAFQVPYAGRNDFILTSNRILKGWTNLALLSRQGHGLDLDGASYGKVDDGSPFNSGSTFAIEAWVKPTTSNSKQVLVEKPGSYSLYIDTLNRVTLKVQCSHNGENYYDPPVKFPFDINAQLTVGKTSYIAVNFTTGTVEDETGSKEYVSQKYYIKASLYVDGVQVTSENETDYPKTVTVETAKSAFYLGVGGDNTFFYDGIISHVRVWGRVLKSNEIEAVQQRHGLPTNQEGLVAGWNFDEMSGTIAKDIGENADLVLTSNELWTIWQDVARLDILVNGYESAARRLTASDVGGYGDTQFTAGGSLESGTAKLPFKGQMDDIRLFDIVLTEQQVRQSMNKSLQGTEDDLAGYWKIDAGSGGMVYDMTGRGNNGTLTPGTALPTWEDSTAPIQNEGAVVVNTLDGLDTHLVAEIEGEPAVIEYAAAERDAYDRIYSVMKRGYFFVAAGNGTVLDVGYKVGDLDTIFVGQVQSKPSVVGYIEGGPPLPSENQTLVYWSGADGGPARLYDTTSIVTYHESETRTWSFSGNQSSTFSGSFNIKGGFYQKTKSDVSVGLGAEAETQTLETTLKFGAKLALSGDIGSSQGVAQSHSSSVNHINTLAPTGAWEPADNILNPTVGRRYIQNNIGLAVVKSATADLYMMALKGTQTPVGYTMVPNKTIPVDTNLIDFPIDPKYVKNGTLDGKVGLVNDPDYPNANVERGSYFKPVEAYNLKRRIEKQEQEIKAYYDQFDEGKYKFINSLDKLKDKLSENTSYNFTDKLNQRSIFNNYVWSAAGGLHKEEHSTANSYTETYTGNSSLTFAAGLEFIADIGTLFGGFYIEADVLLGNTWAMTATKSESTDNGFNLTCAVNPTNFLNPPIMSYDKDGKLQFDGYAATPAPGKVDTYRYMAFLLAPAKENFAQLTKVIDQNWLNNSTSASASAMREATSSENGPWRILYRTTFVSRVPAPFQPVKDDTNAPNVTPPANLESNTWMTRIVAELVGSTNPSALEIGAAVDRILGTGSTGDGILTDIIPWWSDFYAAARVYGSVEFLELAELREDLLQYMIDKYQSDQYLDQ